MADKYFNLKTKNLIVEATDGFNLKFKDRITGEVLPATDEKTMTYTEENIDVMSASKFANSYNSASRDKINTRIKLEHGCPKCKTLVVNMRQYGDQRKVVYSCPECYYSWSTF